MPWCAPIIFLSFLHPWEAYIDIKNHGLQPELLNDAAAVMRSFLAILNVWGLNKFAHFIFTSFLFVEDWKNCSFFHRALFICRTKRPSRYVSRFFYFLHAKMLIQAKSTEVHQGPPRVFIDFYWDPPRSIRVRRGPQRSSGFRWDLSSSSNICWCLPESTKSARVCRSRRRPQKWKIYCNVAYTVFTFFKVPEKSIFFLCC